jgi:serine/threonine protein kinase
MTATPINKSFINFEDDFTRESFTKVLKTLSTNNKYIMPFLHFDILHKQKLMIKIEKVYENGSIKDLIYKSSAMNSYGKKYQLNKGKALSLSLVSIYGRQILEALVYLHRNKWYHMHIHSGNVLLDETGQEIHLTGLEIFVNDLPIRNEHVMNYAFENFNGNNFNANHGKLDKNASILTDIFKNTYNIFEKIDIISFGRLVYEMAFGKELKAPFPDNLEYQDMDPGLAEVLRMIFYKKESNINTNFMYSVPEVTASELLKLRFFDLQNEDKENKRKSLIYIGRYISDR